MEFRYPEGGLLAGQMSRQLSNLADREGLTQEQATQLVDDALSRAADQLRAGALLEIRPDVVARYLLLDGTDSVVIYHVTHETCVQVEGVVEARALPNQVRLEPMEIPPAADAVAHRAAALSEPDLQDVRDALRHKRTALRGGSELDQRQHAASMEAVNVAELDQLARAQRAPSQATRDVVRAFSDDAFPAAEAIRSIELKRMRERIPTDKLTVAKAQAFLPPAHRADLLRRNVNLVQRHQGGISRS